MDVYYAPAWGRHYTAAPDGSTRWLTDAEEADLAARTTPERGLFTAAGTGDGAFDRLIRPAGPRPGLSDATPATDGLALARPEAFAEATPDAAPDATPDTAAAPARAPRRAGGVAIAVAAGSVGLVVGLVLGATGVAVGSDDPGAGRPVAEVPAGR